MGHGVFPIKLQASPIPSVVHVQSGHKTTMNHVVECCVPAGLIQGKTFSKDPNVDSTVTWREMHGLLGSVALVQYWFRKFGNEAVDALGGSWALSEARTTSIPNQVRALC